MFSDNVNIDINNIVNIVYFMNGVKLILCAVSSSKFNTFG